MRKNYGQFNWRPCNNPKMKISPKWLITGEGDMIEHEAAESATNGLKTTENEDTAI